MKNNYNEKSNALREYLKSVINESNIDTIKGITAKLDELDEAHKSVEEENSSLKDTIINDFKNSGNTNKPPIDPNEPPKEKTFDEAFDEIFNHKGDK